MMLAQFLRIFLILAGFFTVFSLGKIVFFLIIPGMRSFFPPFLPEKAVEIVLLVFAKDVISFYPTVVLSAMVFIFGFLLKNTDFFASKRQRLSAQRLLIWVSELFVILAVLYAFFVLSLQPSLEAELQKLRYRFDLVRALESRYFELKKVQLLPHDQAANHSMAQEKKRAILQRLINLRPWQRNFAKDERMNYEVDLRIVNSQIQLQEFLSLRKLFGVEKAPVMIGLTIDELLLMAQQKLLEKDPDYYGANILAYQVFCRLFNWEEKSPLPEKQVALAKSLIDQTWSAIYAKTLTVDERQRASYFFRKGKSLGDFQFRNYLEAYYGFLELNKENPTDKEVERYLSLTRAKIKDEILFLQDMDVLFVAPGFSSLVFRHPLSELKESGQEELIRIEKMLDTGQGVFVQGFELLRLDSQGQVLLHWKAPYGKWSSEGLDFRVWDKYVPTSYFPVVLTQTQEHIFMDKDAMEPPVIKLAVLPQELELFFSSRNLPSSIETGLLLLQSSYLAQVGLSPLLLQTEFFLRLAQPCIFLVFLFLVFLFSLMLRPRHLGKKNPLASGLLFVLLPLMVLFFLQGLEWSGQLLVAGLLLALDFMVLTIVVFVFCLVGLGICAMEILSKLKKMGRNET